MTASPACVSIRPEHVAGDDALGVTVDEDDVEHVVAVVHL